MKAKWQDPNKNPDQIQNQFKPLSGKKQDGLHNGSQVGAGTKPSSYSKTDKPKELEPNQAEGVFLAMLQGRDLAEPEKTIGVFGTFPRTSALKESKQQIKSEFEIEFKGLGKANIQVLESNGIYTVVINMAEKSNIPENPILFRNLVQKQLSAHFGVHIKIQVS